MPRICIAVGDSYDPGLVQLPAALGSGSVSDSCEGSGAFTPESTGAKMLILLPGAAAAPSHHLSTLEAHQERSRKQDQLIEYTAIAQCTHCTSARLRRTRTENRRHDLVLCLFPLSAPL